MAVKNTAQVVIGGKIITLGGYESEEYFQKVASYINNKMSELSEMPGYSRQPMETKHTLLSLNVTDDYFKAKKQATERRERMVDVKLLTLLKVYELGNYTRAAEKLSLTQPAVSQHIKQIERELNTVIFDRTGGKIRPTPEGRLVIQYAERVVSLYENLQRSLEDRQRSIDRLRVGITL